MTAAVGRLAARIAEVNTVDGVRLTDAEQLALSWLAVLPALTRDDLANAVRDFRIGVPR